MSAPSRRDFVKAAGGGLAGLAASACATNAAASQGQTLPPAQPTGGGTLTSALASDGAAQAAKPTLSKATIAAAEHLAGVTYTDAERDQMLPTLEEQITAIKALRMLEQPNDLAPAGVFDPRVPGRAYPTAAPSAIGGIKTVFGPLPTNEEDIAFASIGALSSWMARGEISSLELTELYLRRIAAHGETLKCFATVMPERARAEAALADKERAAGRVRGPLHGIPYGLKDLFDADGANTGWGAEIYKDRPSNGDSAVAALLKAAGAVLLGKTTLGALAYGDIWYGGVTRNPFNPDEGSSGSSAGSASATAAGLMGFAIGTETLGSLVSPSHRCGTTALRPTFGRVSRAGAMALCWSLDKVGPICRTVEDTALVLSVLNGFDYRDPSSVEAGFRYDGAMPLGDIRLGYDPAWFEDASESDKAALNAAKSLGARIVPFKLPDLPQAPLVQQLLAEGAAAFEEMTLENKDDLLTWQEEPAWPNSFRAVRFLTAVDLIQIDRLRRQWTIELDAALSDIDVVIGPNFASGMLTPTNFTGHPCLAMRAGFAETKTRTIFGAVTDESAPARRTPEAISLWAPLFEEGPMLRVGKALERILDVARERPAL